MILFCAFVALKSAKRIRDTSFDGESICDKSVYHGHVGMGSTIRATFNSSTEVLKVVKGKLRSRLDNIRQPAIDTIPALNIISNKSTA